MHPISSAFLLATVLSSPLAVAQTFVPLPFHAADVDGHQSLGLPFGAPGFRTQLLIDAGAIAPVGATLTGIQFRADRWLAPAGGLQVPNVTVALSHTSVALANLSATFAANVTSAPTTVFQGTVTLPVQGIGLAGPLPWNIVVAFSQPFAFTTAQGNLLVDIVGNNAAGGSPAYSLDAVQAGGATTQFGVSGDHPSFDNLLLYCTTGNDVIPRLLSPGHTVDWTSTLFFGFAPGVLALGTSALPVPLDLGSIGAPTNSLYFDPILFATHAWTPSFIGWASTFSLAIPNNPAFVGALLYSQSAILEPQANPLGLITSHGVETRLGDEFEVVVVRQLDANDPAAAAGTLVDFGVPAQPEPGAVAIRLVGTFF